MAKINDTTTYPNTTPALSDHLPGTDVSDTGNDANGETVTFTVQALLQAGILTGSGAPASTPSFVGQKYIDTTADTAYEATGTASSADWDEILTAASGSTLTAATSASGDSVPFFDVSDSDNPKQTTIANLIADNSIVTLTGTQTLTNKTLTAPTMTAPVLGTPASGTLTNATGLPIVGGTTGTLSLARGGTGATTAAAARTALGAAALGANTFTGAQNMGGQIVRNFLNAVVTSVTGTLTAATHSGNVLVTSGNVTVPTTAGFTCVLIAGGAHTVTFNSTTSAAMAAGDMMTIIVRSSTVIDAVLTAAADKVSFT